jgi:hypothetical protein
MKLEGGALWVGAQGGAFSPDGRIDLLPFIDRQQGERLSAPTLDFAFEGRRFRLVVDDIQFDRAQQPRGRQVYSLSGTLFGSAD